MKLTLKKKLIVPLTFNFSNGEGRYLTLGSCEGCDTREFTCNTQIDATGVFEWDDSPIQGNVKQ